MNKNKSLPFIIGSVAIIIALLVVFVQYNNKKNKAPSYPPQTSGTPSTSAIKETTKPTTSATPVSTPKTKEYTLAQVATHNTPPDCWTTINGGVYNVTSWISQHPGGEDKIISLCGIDGSSAFSEQHEGERRPASELASFKIGTLKK